VIHIFEGNLKLLPPFYALLDRGVGKHIADRTPEQALVMRNGQALQVVDEELIRKVFNLLRR